MIKKILSLGLAACMLTSAAAISASANAGDPVRRPDITSIVPADADTNTYYFYMPSAWRNEYNDNYDGADLASCSAGIYWWEGDYNCKDNHEGLDGDWPGYSIKETLPEDSNIFVARVPKTISTIIFNNTVDGTDDPANPQYTKAIQTANIGSEYYDANEDGYGFYPNGTTTFDKMIYVCNPSAIEENPFSHKETYKGAWFYYYGNGEYGVEATKAEAEAGRGVYKNGEFPSYGFDINPKELSFTLGDEAKTITPNDSTATAEVTDASVATITRDETTGVVTVTPVKAGTTTVKFTLNNGTEVETKECTVTVKAPEKKANPMKVKVTNKTYKVSKLKKKAQSFTAVKVTKAQGKVTYKVTKKNAKLTFKNGKVTVKKGTKKGSYTMKVKVSAAGKGDYKAGSKTVTIKVTVKK